MGIVRIKKPTDFWKKLGRYRSKGIGTVWTKAKGKGKYKVELFK